MCRMHRSPLFRIVGTRLRFPTRPPLYLFAVNDVCLVCPQWGCDWGPACLGCDLVGAGRASYRSSPKRAVPCVVSRWNMIIRGTHKRVCQKEIPLTTLGFCGNLQSHKWLRSRMSYRKGALAPNNCEENVKGKPAKKAVKNGQVT